MIIHVIRKPYIESSLYENISQHKSGGLNIDKTRIPLLKGEDTSVQIRANKNGGKGSGGWKNKSPAGTGSVNDDWKKGRWAANFLISERTETLLNKQGGFTSSAVRHPTHRPLYSTENSSVLWNDNNVMDTTTRGYSDKGFVSRYFKVVR